MAKRLSAETILAYTLLGEALGEGPEGMAAVAHVLRNRAGSGSFDSMARHALKNKQFSFWNDGRTQAINWINRQATAQQVEEARRIVRAVASGQLPDLTGGAKHYYANQGPNARSEPEWFAPNAPAGAVQIGNHVFAAVDPPMITKPAYGAALSAAMAGAPIPKTMSAETRMARYMEAGKRLAETQSPIAPVGGGLVTKKVATVRAPARSLIQTNDAVTTDRMIDLLSTRSFWNPKTGAAVAGGVTKQLLAQQLSVQPLRPGDAVPNLIPDEMPPLPRARPAAPAVAAPAVPKTAKTAKGKEVEIGKIYPIGGENYVGGVDKNGVGTLTRVSWTPLDEADSPTVLGGIVREEIKKGVGAATIETQKAAPLIVKSATDAVTGVAGGVASTVGGFFGDLFGGGTKQGAAVKPPVTGLRLPTVPSPTIRILQEIHDRRESSTSSHSTPTPAKVSWLPFPTGVATPKAPAPPKPPSLAAGAAGVGTISKTISVPKQIKVLNPAWATVSPEAIAKLQDIHDREEARRMQAQTPQFLTQTVLEPRTIQVPIKTGPIPQPTVQPAAAPASMVQTVAVERRTLVQQLQERGLSPSDAYDAANQLSRERAATRAKVGTTSWGGSKVTNTGESWAAAW